MKRLLKREMETHTPINRIVLDGSLEETVEGRQGIVHVERLESIRRPRGEESAMI